MKTTMTKISRKFMDGNFHADSDGSGQERSWNEYLHFSEPSESARKLTSMNFQVAKYFRVLNAHQNTIF